MKLRPCLLAIAMTTLATAPIAAFAADHTNGRDTGSNTAPAAADFDWQANGGDAASRLRKMPAKDIKAYAAELAEKLEVNENATWICSLAGSGKGSKCSEG